MTEPVSALLGKEAIEQASGLAVRWLDSIKDRDEQVAWRILYEATMSLAQMRAYCNAVRIVHVPLQGFSLEWPQERRDHLRDVWTPWISIYDILPSLEAVTDTLYLREVKLPAHWWQRGKRDRETIVALETDLAGTLAMFLNDVADEIKHAKIYVIPGDFDTDAQSIKDFSELALGLVEDPGSVLVARARTTVMRLRETVLGQGAGLPHEAWQQLENLAFGG